MLPDPGWTHTTYSPTLLLIVSVLYSLVVIAVLLSARRLLVAPVHASRALLPALLVVLAPLPIALIAREHVPVLGSLPFLPHASFCFGNPGALHVIAFVLPIVSTLAALRVIHGPTRTVPSPARS